MHVESEPSKFTGLFLLLRKSPAQLVKNQCQHCCSFKVNVIINQVKNFDNKLIFFHRILNTYVITDNIPKFEKNSLREISVYPTALTRESFYFYKYHF